jgi:hypothetical protein
MRETPTSTHLLERANLSHSTNDQGSNRLLACFSSSEDGDRSSFQDVVFPIYLEFWTMDKVQKSSDSEETACSKAKRKPPVQITAESKYHILGKSMDDCGRDWSTNRYPGGEINR